MLAIRVIRFDCDFVIGFAIDFEAVSATALEFAIATEIVFVQMSLSTQKQAAQSLPLQACG